ncbi:unnamed protein product [Musa acuminata subsp. malaccensis]|uniref:(wild Malaysian banana) hypothetical protein n=1 Tax=Musa acuminata subsp. malaccensis TaxID=214687 RepID=A0A804HWQ8_MUSAM|nr:PREDICTED: uncharacterized protein LOC103999696 [Musa acuminata subsp. malaccensis]CAG1860128.1 unnamed protein product [Musa acuminata subsp. malaccensis]
MAPSGGGGLIDQKQFERQMGCMAGFLHLLDSHQILPRKRFPPSRAAGSTLPLERSDASKEKERQRRSPSVVARLMGLDALPDVAAAGRAELLRSVSESRVVSDPADCPFLDGGSFPKSKSQARRPLLPALQRKSFFDTAGVFTEPKRWESLPVESGKRRLMRGMDEAARNLKTLKQILEAFQLQGVLHSKPSDHQINDRSDHLHDDRYRCSHNSRNVVIEPASTPPQRPPSGPRPPLPPGPGVTRRNPKVESATRPVRCYRRADRTPTGSHEPENWATSSTAKQRSSIALASGKSSSPRRRISAVNPTKITPNQIGQSPVIGRLLPNQRPKQEVIFKRKTRSLAEDDTSGTTHSPLPVDRSPEDCRAGWQLLERCDRLLQSITAFTVTEQVAATAEQQPCPVSVINSPLLGEESSPCSPVSKRSDNSQGDQLTEREDDAIASYSGRGREAPEEEVDDADYVYVAEILRATGSHADTTDAYDLLEKRSSGSPECSKDTRLRRLLVFDAVAEILDRKRCLSPPPWESFVLPGSLSTVAPGGAAHLLPEVWAELRRAGRQAMAGDLSSVTCWAVRRDLFVETLDVWARPAAEVADAVFQIERQIFKDLVSATISDLANAMPRAIRSRSKRLF